MPKTAHVTNDDGYTFVYDPAVTVEGARVRFDKATSTRAPGSQDEVTVLPHVAGTVRHYNEHAHECIVRLDTPVTSTDWKQTPEVLASIDDISPLPTRYVFDEAAARPVFDLIERLDDDADVEPQLFAALPDEGHRDMAEWIGLDGFDPAGDSDPQGQIRALIEFAFAVGHLTGPSEPYFERTDDDGMCIVSFHVPAATGDVRLTLDWQDTHGLIDREESDGADAPFHTGAAAAADLLRAITEQMNETLGRLDDYVRGLPDPYSDLLDAATTDFEREVLDGLREKAGLLWVCECGNRSSRDVTACESCDLQRRQPGDGDLTGFVVQPVAKVEGRDDEVTVTTWAAAEQFSIYTLREDTPTMWHSDRATLADAMALGGFLASEHGVDLTTEDVDGHPIPAAAA